MLNATATKVKMDEWKTCVVIPTYNNAANLGNVIKEVSEYTNHIIVVNDGSTDHTLQIVAQYPQVQLITYEQNVGKGWALRKAFLYSINKDYCYAITIDSDGQHFAKDLPLFMDKIEQEPNSLIIGARNMGQDSVPSGSSFGNKFSNFWFKLETGISSPDTQSGYRLYPLLPIKQMHFFTKKYEFEIEVLVRCAWANVPVNAVPVTVYYPPANERITHFRPFKDFFRISILNTLLVLITFLYIKPRNLFRSIFIKKNFVSKIQEQILNSNDSPQKKAFSVGFGVFMGIIPIWGFQLAAAIFLAIVCKLNKALVIIAANISVPPMIPFILFASYQLGAVWMGKNAMQLSFSRLLTLDVVKKNIAQYIFGSITLAIVAGFLFCIITFCLLKIFSKQSKPVGTLNP